MPKVKEVTYYGLHWENFEPMAQKVTSDKERKEKEGSEKKKNIPFIQVDKGSDPISNFIANLRRQFRTQKVWDWAGSLGANVLNNKNRLPNLKA